jgi:hypothetical protein
MTPKCRIWLYVFGGLSLLMVGVFLVAPVAFWTWSAINYWTYDADIFSGRIRYTRYFFFVPVRQKIEDSALTRALQAEDYPGTASEWRRVLTLSPGVGYSPHYAFHAAIAQIRELELVWEMGQFTPAARRATAKRVLELWQKEKNDGAADHYIRAVADLAFRSDANKRCTNETDLP